MIDIWHNTDSWLLLNPAYSVQDQQSLKKILEMSQDWPNHVWIATSGSSSSKFAGLSKEAILLSAQVVNAHLLSNSIDRWIHVLPDFHIGGLSIWARAHLSGATVYDFKNNVSKKWNARSFCDYVDAYKGTLVSLVPTQIYDLVLLRMAAPKSLRAVIVGGGWLLPELYKEAVNLGWPLLPSYGLTECCSQVATATLDGWNKLDHTLYLLPNFVANVQQGCLSFFGRSLLSVYAYLEGNTVSFKDPKVNGWFITEDWGKILGQHVEIGGRVDQKIKIGGESVDFSYLENHLQYLRLKRFLNVDAALVAFPDNRLGYVIQLALVGELNDEIKEWINEFQNTVLPFERIRKIHPIVSIPRSSLGKVIKSELLMLIGHQM